MNRFKRILPALAFIALTLTVVACGSAPSAANTPEGAQVVNVSLTDYSLKFSPGTIKPGVVKLVVKNDATDAMHEMLLVKTDLTADRLPLTTDGSKVDESSAAFTKLGSVDDLDPGQTGDVMVTLQPGRYVYFCNQPGHYKAGMRGELTVSP
jgi:uncharacterized cupredoxin-like copper-binding protein